jgi:hypothetical protein
MFKPDDYYEKDICIFHFYLGNKKAILNEK